MVAVNKRVSLVMLAVGASLAVGGIGAPVSAGERPGSPPRDESAQMDVPYDPLLEDFLMTDAMESQAATTTAGVTCSYETVQTKQPGVPLDGSFQMVYVVPSGVTADPWVDVPRSCSDGSVRYSSLARSSRNMASWQAAQGAGLHYRTLNLTYTHNYTNKTYPTRLALRFRSAYTEVGWSNMTSRQKLDTLRQELSASGFNLANTKYMALVDAGAFQTCDTSGCSHAPGVAQVGGAYGLAIRYYIEAGTYATKYYRYGCGTYGDTIFNHEATHEVGVQHVGDDPRDMMTADGGFGYTIRSSPSTVWDYGRDSYHSGVRSSPFVSLSGLSGNYFTC